MDFAHLGSSLSLRSFARVGSNVKIFNKIEFSDATNYIQENAGASTITMVAGGTTSLTVSSTGGTLHGVWISDGTISTSDRRLKENIKPLLETLQTNFATNKGQAAAADAAAVGKEADKSKSEDVSDDDDSFQMPKAMGWLLRELRPVSYNLNTGSEHKKVRFGFIADEIEEILPQVVRTNEKDDYRKKGIVYPDLVAVLTSMVQQFNDQMKVLTSRMKIAEAELDRLDDEDPMDDDEDDIAV